LETTTSFGGDLLLNRLVWPGLYQNREKYDKTINKKKNFIAAVFISWSEINRRILFESYNSQDLKIICHNTFYISFRSRTDTAHSFLSSA